MPAARSQTNTDRPTSAVDYQGGHRSPGRRYGATLDRLDDLVGADIYNQQVQRQYFGSGPGDPDIVISDRQSWAAINQAKGRPDLAVTVYRAIPEEAADAINPGDWVTLSPHYALQHGKRHLSGGYHVVKITVRASELWWDASSINEFGWDPPQHDELV